VINAFSEVDLLNFFVDSESTNTKYNILNQDLNQFKETCFMKINVLLTPEPD
jgi:hypothetical protein